MKTALVVIDCQNDFKKGASPYSCEMLDDALIRRIGELISFCRRKTIPIVYTQHSIKPDKSNEEFGEPKEVLACIIGTAGWEIVEELKPEAGDFVIQKDKYDAFYGSDLEQTLRAIEADTVIICGVLTNNCVRATAEGAHYRNFTLYIAGDCCGATSYISGRTNEEIHTLTLLDLKERMYETNLVSLKDLRQIFVN